MLSVSSLIEFLLSLLRDDEALAEFEADPDGVLARSGLTGVTAGDVRDVAPLLADRDGVSFCGDDGGSGGGPARVQHDRPDRVEHHAPRHHDDDPVREIHHVTRNYHAEPSVTVNHHNTFNEYTYVDNRVIDDRDIHIEGDGNSVAQDSFNQDNDGVDNKGGEITDSVVGGGNVSDSGNDNDGVDNDGVIVDSLNEGQQPDRNGRGRRLLQRRQQQRHRRRHRRAGVVHLRRCRSRHRRHGPQRRGRPLQPGIGRRRRRSARGHGSLGRVTKGPQRPGAG